MAESDCSKGVIFSTLSEIEEVGTVLGSNTALTSEAHNFTTCINSSHALLA